MTDYDAQVAHRQSAKSNDLDVVAGSTPALGARIGYKYSTSGIYQITNVINGYRYIGSTSRLGHRWEDHRRTLRGNYHKNSKLQNAWNKYGEENFIFEPLYIAEINMLCSIEQWYLDSYLPEYNIAKHVLTSTLGLKISAEVKAAWSVKRKGRKLSQKHKSLIAQGLMGRVVTSETRIKQSAANNTKVKIVAKQIDGNRILIYDSFIAAAKDGFSRSSIQRCIKGKRKTHKGYLWNKYEENDMTISQH